MEVSIIIFLLLTLLYIIIIFYNNKYIIPGYIISYFIWPPYIAIKFGILPSLTLDRLIFLIIIFIFFDEQLNKYSKFRIDSLIKLFILLNIIYFISLIINYNSININVSINGLINEIINTIIFLIIVEYNLSKYKNKQQILHSIIIASIIINIFALIELKNNSNIFQNYIITKNIYTENLKIAYRNEQYRPMGTFENSLIYGQYLVFVVIISFYIIKKYKHNIESTLKYIYIINILISIYLITRTDSRTAILCIIFAAIYYIIKINIKLTPIIIIFLSVILVFTIITGILNIILYNVLFGNMEYLYSTNSRIMQIYEGFQYFIKQPLFGYGITNASNLFTKKYYDSFYLGLILEAGIIGFIIYLIIIYKQMLKIRKLTNNIDKIFYSIIIILFQIYNLFLAYSTNHIILYIIFIFINSDINKLKISNYFKNYSNS